MDGATVGGMVVGAGSAVVVVVGLRGRTGAGTVVGTAVVGGVVGTVVAGMSTMAGGTAVVVGATVVGATVVGAVVVGATVVVVTTGAVVVDVEVLGTTLDVVVDVLVDVEVLGTTLDVVVVVVVVVLVGTTVDVVVVVVEVEVVVVVDEVVVVVVVGGGAAKNPKSTVRFDRSLIASGGAITPPSASVVGSPPSRSITPERTPPGSTLPTPSGVSMPLSSLSKSVFGSGC